MPSKKGKEKKSSLEKTPSRLSPKVSADDVYEYLLRHGAAAPHIVAKALNIDESTVMSALKELEKQGKVRLRSTNIEWKSKRPSR